MWRYALEEPRATCLLGEYTRAWRVAARRNIRTFSPVWLGRRNFEHRAFLPGSHVTSRYNSGTHGCNLPESCFTMSMNGLPNPGSAAKLLVCQRSRAPKVVVARTVPNSAVDQLFFSAVLPLIDLCAGHTKLHAVHAAQKIPTQTLRSILGGPAGCLQEAEGIPPLAHRRRCRGVPQGAPLQRNGTCVPSVPVGER
jgi:hypothetical protein